MEIRNITLLLQKSYDGFRYAGTLRNEKKFSIGDKVFFVHGQYELSFGVIIGIELSDSDNPNYLYKIKLHDSVCEYSKKNNEGEFDIAYRSNLICSEIFDSIQEAKASALKRHQQEIELRANEIENYFKQFKN
jgi:hypothetical protein